MTAIPSKSSFTDPATTEGEFKTAVETLHDYLTGMLGSAGTQSAALSALGSLGGVVSTRSANYTVTASDRGAAIACSGTFTLALTSAATLGPGFLFAVINSGTGIITVDPDGVETLDGRPSLQIQPNSSAVLISTGSAWYTVGGATSSAGSSQLFVASGTFTVPSGVSSVQATIIGGGGGGGKGGSVLTYAYGSQGDQMGSLNLPLLGGSGGAGGQWYGAISVTSGASMAVTVGAGGAGSNTAAGAAGGASSFGGMTGSGGGGGGSGTGTAGAPGAISAGGYGRGRIQYDQPLRRRAAGATAAVAYSESGLNAPGAGGEGGWFGNNNAAGGVGGLVLIEW